MGLAKLIVDIKALVALVLEDSEKTIRLSSTEPLPEDSRFFDMHIADNNLIIILTHQALPEPIVSIESDRKVEVLEALVQVESFEVTEDQQLRLTRYEVELRHLIHLNSIAGQLTLKQFSDELIKLTTRTLSVLRHEDPDKVLEVAGMNPLFKIERDDSLDEKPTEESADEAPDNKSE